MLATLTEENGPIEHEDTELFHQCLDHQSFEHWLTRTVFDFSHHPAKAVQLPSMRPGVTMREARQIATRRKYLDWSRDHRHNSNPFDVNRIHDWD